jgi:hypothetical protein
MHADAKQLAERGFASNLCAAWLAFWPYVAAQYGDKLEEAYWRTFTGKRPKTARQIAAEVSRSTMALMSAAVRADKSRSQVRRFHCSAWALESYRAGLELISDELPDDEKRKQRANLARYWRSRWAVLHLFQNVTGLALFPRTSREWRENRTSHEAAAYTDNATDLFLDIAGRGGRFRPGLSRVARFEQATSAAVEAFRKKVGEYAPDYVMPNSPLHDAHVKDFERIEAKRAAAEEAEGAGPKEGAKVISFTKAKARMAEAVEILKARAAAGQLTREEADEIVMLLAPVVALTRGAESSEGLKDVVPSEDSPEKSSAESRGGFGDFPGKVEGEPAVSEDNNIRRTDPADVTLDAFLAAFRPDASEPVRPRIFPPKDAPKTDPRFWAYFGKKYLTTRGGLADGTPKLAELREANKAHGVYFVVNQGGDSAAQITRITSFFAESDEGSIAEQHELLDACPLPPSIRVETKKSVHAYWLAAPGCAVEEWREVQRRLIHYFKSDEKIKDPSRVMRLPHFNHVTYTSGLLSYKPVTVAAFDPLRRFTAGELLAAFPAAPEEKPKPKPTLATLAQLTGSFEAYKRELGARISEHETARRNGRGNWDCRAVCHDGRGDTGLFYDPAANSIICNKGCDLRAIAAAFGLGEYRADEPKAERGKQNAERDRGTL